MSDDTSAGPPWVPSGIPDGPIKWDQDEAEGLVGLLVLVGLTYLASDGNTVTSQSQYYGRILSVDETKGFEIVCEGKWAGKTMTLPPVLQAFHHANPGQYRLRSTVETIENPDLTTTWSITQPSKS
jgi:hypothetical protein